jgi:4-hydroxythreonine-4-phosphate dehydrogenase
MIGISMGDPNGVGPDILLRTYAEGNMPENSIVIGDYSVLLACNEHLGLDVSIAKITKITRVSKGALHVYDAAMLTKQDLRPGQISPLCGEASLKYVELGTRMALDREIDALVTLPVNKQAIRATLEDFSGHTGYIAALCNATNYTMMLVASRLIVTHVSTHVSLQEAIGRTKKENILPVIRLTHDALKQLGKPGKIAVAGLNPHAGEDNAFGAEDSMEIAPAVQIAAAEGINVEGPVPADTVFYQAVKGIYDAVVCMYHDQGHIPIKLLDFESAVNVTLGLPIVRTSVDHGTAYDIAWKGVASTSSFLNAIDLALKLI